MIAPLHRYEMTPVRKKPKKSANEEDYDIKDIKSDDSTDEEDAPKKKIPNWAVGKCPLFLYILLI